MSLLLLLLRNLILTVLIEGVLVIIFTKRKSTAYHSVLVNTLTNPLVNITLILFSSFAVLPVAPYYYILLAILEIAAFITEGILYNKMGDFSLKKAFFASFLLNASSFGMGALFL